MTRVANYLDFLVVFDDHIRRSNLGSVVDGFEMIALARQDRPRPGDQSPARWTGELEDGYIGHGPRGLGDRRPLTPGRSTP